MAHELYVFSGLGIDERIFHRLDFSGFPTTYIKWITPKDKETIEAYATRLREQITTPNPTLIGLSFGGMMAIEVAKQIETEKVILISSAKSKNEIPFYYRIAGVLGMDKILPINLLKKSTFLTSWLFGAKSKPDKQLLKQVIHDTDPVFLRWAIGQVARWENQILPANLSHIHGTSDKVLPIWFITCDYPIKKGGHLITLNRADEVNKILRQLLEKTSG